MMMLSDVERKVLEVAEFQADAPISELASKAKLRTHVVYHAITKMLERGVIERRAYFDSYLLGTRPFIIFASIPPHRESVRFAFINFLKKHPSISFFAEVAGIYNFWIEIRSEDIFNLEHTLLHIAEKFGDVLHRKEILAMPSHVDFSSIRQDGERRKKGPQILTYITNRSIKLDDMDFTIMNSLTREWVTSHKALAKELGIPASTLIYRIERMKREKLIMAARFYVNFTALGEQRFLHLVSVNALSEKLKAEFMEFAHEQRSVCLLRSFIGRWDFLFETHHKFSESAAEFTVALHSRFPVEIGERETLSVLSFTKTSDCTAKKQSV